MAIYLGNTKVSGAGVQVDSALSNTSTKPVQNQVVTQALQDVGYPTWQKPADWVDIRSGALADSVYFLVAHSTPTESGGTYTVSTYPVFTVKAQLSDNTHTYDVFVDGIKVASTAHNTETTINWANLYTAGTIVGGYDVTTPSSLVSHVVRIAPTNSADTLALMATKKDENLGVLWAHFAQNEIPSLDSLFRLSSNRNSNLYAITATDDEIKTGYIQGFLGYYNDGGFPSLITIPKMVITNLASGEPLKNAFCHCTALKKIRLEFKSDPAGKSSDAMFYQCTNLETIELTGKYSIPLVSGAPFRRDNGLKQLPKLSFESSTNLQQAFLLADNGTSALLPTVLDISEGTLISRFVMKDIPGLKGLVVSNQATFSSTSSPQIDISNTGLSRAALVNLFNSMPTVNASQVCNITGATGAADLTAEDIAVAVNKGWTITR